MSKKPIDSKFMAGFIVQLMTEHCELFDDDDTDDLPLNSAAYEDGDIENIEAVGDDFAHLLVTLIDGKKFTIKVEEIA